MIQALNRFLGILFRRIQKGDDPEESHIVLIFRMKDFRILNLSLFCRYPDDMHSLLVQTVRKGGYALLIKIRHIHIGLVHANAATAGKNGLHCAFRNQHFLIFSGENLLKSTVFRSESRGNSQILILPFQRIFPVFLGNLFHIRSNQNAHSSSFKIIRNLIRLDKTAGILIHMILLSISENCPVNHIFYTGGIKGIHPGIVENQVGALSVTSQILLQDNIVLGQCSGLIRTEYIHRPQILNRRHIFHNRLLLRQELRPFCQRSVHNHRKHAGRNANRHGNSKEKCFQPVFLDQAINQKDKNHHQNHVSNQNPGNLCKAPIKIGTLLLLMDAGRNTPEVGVFSGKTDDPDSCPRVHR